MIVDISENCVPRLKPHHAQRNRSFGTDLTNQCVQPKIDIIDIKNPSCLGEYAAEIYTHLHQTESDFTARPDYMFTQEHITEKMRGILIDWLVEVHNKFKLSEETLFLTVNLIDRYLENTQVTREQLQLVGVSSMLIACKYEEIYAPAIKDFVFITDSAYTAEQVIAMENRVLRVLNFNVTTPSAFRFLQRYARICECDEHSFNLARYLIELALVEYRLLKFKPSNIAASAMFLAQKILKSFSRSLSEQTPSTDAEIRACAKELAVVAQRAEKYTLQAVRKKFMHERFGEVAKIPIKF